MRATPASYRCGPLRRRVPTRRGAPADRFFRVPVVETHDGRPRHRARRLPTGAAGGPRQSRRRAVRRHHPRVRDDASRHLRDPRPPPAAPRVPRDARRRLRLARRAPLDRAPPGGHRAPVPTGPTAHQRDRRLVHQRDERLRLHRRRHLPLADPLRLRGEPPPTGRHHGRRGAALGDPHDLGPDRRHLCRLPTGARPGQRDRAGGHDARRRVRDLLPARRHLRRGGPAVTDGDATGRSPIPGETATPDEWSIPRIVRTMVPLLAGLSVLQLVSGTVLETYEAVLVRNPALLVLVPVQIGTAGNLASITCSRLTTQLYLGTYELSPSNPALRANAGAVFGLAATVFGAVGIAAWGIGLALGGSLALGRVLLISLVSGLCLAVLVVVASVAAVEISYRVGLNPDDTTIPVVTNVCDIAGVLILFAVVSVVV